METNHKVLVLIPGFGTPYLDHKTHILKKNIQILEKSGVPLSIHICAYDTNPNIQLDSFILSDPRITVFYKRGFVGTFIDEHQPIIESSDCTHVILLLDDIELDDNYDIRLLLQLTNPSVEGAFDILSPSLTHNSQFSHTYLMLENINSKSLIPPKLYNSDQPYIILLNQLELFCYFMRKETFIRYVKCANFQENPWTWGMDLVIQKVFHFRVGCMSHTKMHHHYKGTCYRMRPERDPHKDMIAYLEKNGLQGLEANPYLGFIGFH